MFDCHGYAVKDHCSLLEPYSFSRQEPSANEVLIDINYCGICHSDIHMVRNEWGFSLYPMVPGHEIVGTVRSVGDHVSKYKVGDKVGVGCFIDSCRQCPSCLEGEEQFCQQGMTMTYSSKRANGELTQGGYSNQIVVDENYILKLPENLPMDATAPLLCAGITLFSPLIRWQAGPNKKVAIVGLGGLGHIGIKIARAMGAEVTVLSHSDRKKDDSKRLGAHYFYSTADSNVFIEQSEKYDLVINTVSAQIDWNLYLGILKKGCAMIMVGMPDEPVGVDPKSLIFGRKLLAGSLIGGIKETQEMLDFCGEHNISADIELISPQQINEAYERVLKSDVRYRFVIDMAKL